MPSQTLALALAGSVYPPALAAVIALGRGAQVRSRVFVFVLAALLVTYAVGALILYVLVELGVTGSRHLTPGAALQLALGVLLMLLALRLHRRRPAPDATPPDGTPSRIEHYLESRRLAFVLGIVLYVLPSPIYIGAVKAIADANYSTGDELLVLAVTVLLMLWMIELPMLMLLVVPVRAAGALERVNLWFARHGRTLAILVCLAVGAYLIVKGLARLIG